MDDKLTTYFPRGGVPRRGFHWASGPPGQPKGALWLEPVDVGEVENELVRPSPRPVDEAVFLEFMACAPDAPGFLRFANTYGVLFSGWDIGGLLSLPNSGETFDAWMATHDQVRRLTSLWSDAPGGEGKPRDAALLHREISEHLAAGIKVNLTPETALQVVPDNLSSAIWLRFAEAIAFGRQFQPCQRCNRWMYIPHDGSGRSTRRYCSDTCRLGSYRTRQVEAVELGRDGTSPEEIAQRLGSTPETVRRWIQLGGPNAMRRAREQRRREGQQS